MNPETVDGLRKEASRGDYPSMARLARALSLRQVRFRSSVGLA
ncbi:hypothetical protein ACWCQP_47925 [Streptomyces chartreusis]